MNLNDYEMFVQNKLSEPSTDFETMIASLTAMHEIGDSLGIRIPELLTAAAGLAAEGGEFGDIVKKLVFQGKPLTEENKIALIKELGDIFFYMMVGCAALGVTADEVINLNYDKLSKRYKDGFTVDESENRTSGDS